MKEYWMVRYQTDNNGTKTADMNSILSDIKPKPETVKTEQYVRYIEFMEKSKESIAYRSIQGWIT